MLMKLILLIGGILLAVLPLVFIKRLPRAWVISLIATGLVTAVIGGILTYDAVESKREDDRNVHIALRYLEAGLIDDAAHYLKKIENDSFASVAAEVLTEKLRGNDTLAKIKLDALDGQIHSDAEETIYLSLNAVSAYDYSTMEAAVSMLHNNLGLSEKAVHDADVQYVTESGNYIEGIEADYSSMSDEEHRLMDINNQSRYGVSYSAVTNAAQLLSENPSAENRLLFAELLADAAYDGEYFLSDGIFPDEAANEKLRKEHEKLSGELTELTLSADGLAIKLEAASDSSEKDKLTTELAKLNERIAVLRGDYEYLYLYRALSSISDIFSLDAAVVRARIHFAMKDYDRAVDCIKRAASNFFIRLSADGSVKNALNVIRKSFKNDDTVGTASAEFRDAVSTVISQTGTNLVGTRSNRLTLDFSDYLMTEQKEYGSDLYITSLDLSAFPDITLTVAGRDTAVEELLSFGGNTVRDTHYDVKYKARAVEYENTKMDICCVVDQSGRMSGYPTENLKKALSGFIDALGEDTRIGIVGFENFYEILCPMSENHALAAAAVPNIRADGGTEITSGIEGAMEALTGSANRKTVLLMTDGQSYVDMETVRRAAEMGCVIHCIGFGDVNDEILQSVADATGGQYIRAETSAELINVYLDLVGMIGNEVEITYTAKEKSLDDGARYVFISTDKTGSSVKYYYTLGNENTPKVGYVENALITREDLDWAKQNNDRIWIDICGKNLAGIVEVIVGGETVPLYNGDSYSTNVGYVSDDRINLSLSPNLADGWHTITLKDADGNAFTYDNMCCVGSALNAYMEVYFGDLIISVSSSTVLSDGTLVIESPYLRAGDLFSATAYGLLSVTCDKAMLEEAEQNGFADGLSVPKSASLRGSGSLRMDSSDAAFVWNSSDVIAAGNYQIVYNQDELRVVEQHGEEEN